MKQSRCDCHLSPRKEAPPRERRGNLAIRLVEIDLRSEREVSPIDRSRSIGSSWDGGGRTRRQEQACELDAPSPQDCESRRRSGTSPSQSEKEGWIRRSTNVDELNTSLSHEKRKLK